MKKKIHILFLVCLTLLVASCGDDWLNVKHSTSLSSLDAVESYNDVSLLLIGAYDGVQANTNWYGARMIYYGDVRGEDMQGRESGMRVSGSYEMTYTALNAPDMWGAPYAAIMRANEVIFSVADGLADINAPGANDAERRANVNNLLGQALAIRALAHFDLVRVHAQPYTKPGSPSSWGVPIRTERQEIQYYPTRNTVEEVYAAVIADLTQAIPLLTTARRNAYINQWGAKALLARVYLFKGDFNNAYAMAEDVIANSGHYALWELDEYVEAWGSPYGKEMIFEIRIATQDDWTDREGIAYLMSEDGYADYIMTKTFVDLMKQPEHESDVRRGVMGLPKLANFAANPYWGNEPIFLRKLPGQYSSDLRLNNIPLLRLSEQYLIAAEAALKKSSPDQTKADEYLNAIISRRNPSRGFVTATQETILLERRIELIGEGHRFFDAMRLGLTITRPDDGWHVPLQPDSKSYDWNYFRTILPIPTGEMDANPNIRDQQNPGY